MKKLFLLFSICVVAYVAIAQEKANNYVMKSIDGYVHLYFDDQYYLVDQNCEFKTYTRVIRYDRSKGGFNGFFTDYYNNDIPALTGTYVEGKKDGEFKGFYPSGKLRSIQSYHNDVPNNKWQYFYSNGSPWITIEFKNQIPYVQEFWNTKGKQKVKDGKGSFKLMQEAYEYSEYGYSGFVFKGSIRNGRPNGIWTTLLDYGGKTEELTGTEFYIKNQLIESNYTYPRNVKSNQSLIGVLPISLADRSANLISKGCSIDENKGFNQYLQNYLNNTLPQVWMLLTPPLEETFDIQVQVNKKGTRTKITLPNTLPQEFGGILDKALQGVPYWIPSFVDNETIDDTLVITITKSVNEKGETSFGYPIINRKNGK